MRSGNRIAIVGAGIAGLVCAKVLIEDGFTVEIFDRSPDIGGVWSETRRYPGLRAQSTKDTYHFSDHPMPADYPRVLDGARMQEYLASYVRAFGLTDRLRLRTEVVAADPVDGGWLLEIRDPDGVHRTSCEHLVIANGVFSEPRLPDFAGAADFARSGGQLGHATQFLDVEAVRDRSVVVVGYGAAAGDLATEISRVAADTTVVARRLLWKMPRRLAPGVTAERVLLTRTGTAHFRHPEPGRFERLLHGPLRSFRESNLDLIEALVAERSRAAEFGLLPDQRFEHAHEAAFGLVTDGFAEQLAEGRLTVRGQTRVTRLGGGPAGPYAELSDGQRIRADIVVCATGFQQRVPFLTPYVQRQLTDDHGNFRLYRQILPLDVPHLSFAGYNTSLLSAVGAEVGAHWTAALLSGGLMLPSAEVMNERVETRLRWMDEVTGGRHAHGAAVTPYALRDIDVLLDDLGVRLPWTVRAAQWLRPVRPGDYRTVSRRRRSTGHTVTPPPTSRDTAPSAAPSQTAAAEPSGSQPAPPVPPAEPPTVRIPESAVGGNASARTALLPTTDPTARTGPVREFRPANPAPGAATSPPAPPAPPARPAAPPASSGRQHAPARVETTADAARRAAAETRAAGIAARSNSPTVQIDMRNAQTPVAAAAPVDDPEPPDQADGVDGTGEPPAQASVAGDDGTGAAEPAPVTMDPETENPMGDRDESRSVTPDRSAPQAQTIASPPLSAEPDAAGGGAAERTEPEPADPAVDDLSDDSPESAGQDESGAMSVEVAAHADVAEGREAPVGAEPETGVVAQEDPAARNAAAVEPAETGTLGAGTTPEAPEDTEPAGAAETTNSAEAVQRTDATAESPEAPPTETGQPADEVTAREDAGDQAGGSDRANSIAAESTDGPVSHPDTGVSTEVPTPPSAPHT